jgi:hypothetical protein
MGRKIRSGRYIVDVHENLSRSKMPSKPVVKAPGVRRAVFTAIANKDSGHAQELWRETNVRTEI